MRSRGRKLRISIRPFRGVRVSLPFGVTLAEAEKFLLSKEKWLISQLSKIRAYEKEVIISRENDRKFDLKTACDHLYQRLILLAKEHDFHFNRITFRRQKTRWGSCSAKNNLNLNVKLYNLPQELQDYVILHELVHTRIKNHSERFWQELERILPDARKLNKELKNYSLLVL